MRLPRPNNNKRPAVYSEYAQDAYAAAVDVARCACMRPHHYADPDGVQVPRHVEELVQEEYLRVLHVLRSTVLHPQGRSDAEHLAHYMAQTLLR